MRKMYFASASIDESLSRVYFKDGVCKSGNAAILDKPDMFVRRISYTGQKRNQMKALNIVPDEFLGIQNVVKVEAPAKLNEDGIEIPKRKKFVVTPELLKQMQELAEGGKSVMQASEILGIAYPILSKTAKEEKIVFVRGKRGGKPSKAIAPELLESAKKLADSTLKEAAAKLGITYAALVSIAKKNNLTFKAGKKGRQSSGEKKPVDPLLLDKIQKCSKEGLTISQATKELGVAWYVVVKIAKENNITFIKGKRGKQKKA